MESTLLTNPQHVFTAKNQNKRYPFLFINSNLYWTVTVVQSLLWLIQAVLYSVLSPQKF